MAKIRGTMITGPVGANEDWCRARHPKKLGGSQPMTAVQKARLTCAKLDDRATASRCAAGDDGSPKNSSLPKVKQFFDKWQVSRCA